jgi:hypothetical protein
MGLQMCRLMPSLVVQCGNAAKRGGNIWHPFLEIQRPIAVSTRLQAPYVGGVEAVGLGHAFDKMVAHAEILEFSKGPSNWKWSVSCRLYKYA